MWRGVCMHLLLAAVSSSVLRSVGWFVVVGCNASFLPLPVASVARYLILLLFTAERTKEAPLSPFEVIHLHPVVVSSVPPSRPNPTPEGRAREQRRARFLLPRVSGGGGRNPAEACERRPASSEVTGNGVGVARTGGHSLPGVRSRHRLTERLVVPSVHPSTPRRTDVLFCRVK